MSRAADLSRGGPSPPIQVGSTTVSSIGRSEMPITRTRSSRIVRYALWWLCLASLWYGLVHRTALEHSASLARALSNETVCSRRVRTRAEAMAILRSWLRCHGTRPGLTAFHEICTVHLIAVPEAWVIPLLERDERGRPKRHRWVAVDAETGRVDTGVSVCGERGPPTGCDSR
jgi:hypothetical protein